MKRKHILWLIVLFAVMLCAASPLLLCSCEKEPPTSQSEIPNGEEITGGMIEEHEPTSYKPIESKNIVFFELSFDNSDCIYEDEPENALHGLYKLTLEKTESTTRYFISCRGCDGRCIDLSSVCDDSALVDLQRLIDDKEIAKLNGWSKRNSALGCYLSLDVLYDSGESIYAYGEGGYDVMPDKYWNERWFLDFFNELAEKNGDSMYSGVTVKEY